MGWIDRSQDMGDNVVQHAYMRLSRGLVYDLLARHVSELLSIFLSGNTGLVPELTMYLQQAAPT